MQRIDRGWTFERADVAGAQAKLFDDSTWEKINLPHSFSMPYFASPNFYTGYGWYRRKLTIACTGEATRYFLEFDGVFRVAQVFVNGKQVGEHSSGYTGFSIDITPQVTEGDNVISVRVNNLWNAALTPRAGEHTFSGGIYRHVRLVRTHALHVAWYGTFVSTPSLSAAGGAVHISTELRNDLRSPATYELSTTVKDAHGEQVTQVASTEQISAQASAIVEQDTPYVAHPNLWSPSTPSLYTAVTTVRLAGKVVDQFETRFGFRWFQWTAEQGLFLNGKHFYFHGADVHQDHAGWGDAVSDDGIAMDVGFIKNAGMDFIRGSHYPHSPVFADECDKQGVMLWSENAFWGIGGANTEGTWTASAFPVDPKAQTPFEESVRTSLAEMIRVNRNHPSIVAWSMGNEVFFSAPSVMPKVRSFLRQLVEDTHKLDPTRPAGIGGVQRGDLDHIGDIAGYNGDGARLFIDPGLPNFVSEYGLTETNRPGEYAPGFGEIAGQPQFSWRSGQALWCGFDHGSIVPDLGITGMVDYFRLPKRQWYWYRNAYMGVAPPAWPAAGKPAGVRLTADRKVIAHADGRGSVHLIVTVLDADGHAIANDVPVRLEVLSGPGELPTGRVITFRPDSDIAIRDGEAAIEMRSYWSGMIRIRASSPGLRSSELQISSTGAPPFHEGVSPVPGQVAYRESRADSTQYGPSMDATLNHPTLASSEAPGHEARFANDSLEDTYWQALPGDKSPWWEVDFENRVVVDSIKPSFESGTDVPYDVDITSDRKSWSTIARHHSGEPPISIGEMSEQLRSGLALRIRFTQGKPGTPVRLAEAHVIGRAIHR